jgi:hypothetical protein
MRLDPAVWQVTGSTVAFGMHRHRKFTLAVGALVAALGFCPAIAAPLGQQPGTATRADHAADQTTVRVRGKIEHYDAATRRLRVTTATGPTEFAVPATAHVSRRGKTIDQSELEHLTGSGVVVRYYPDAEGHIAVKSIHVVANSETVRP